MPKNKTKMSESIRRNRAAIACYVITISVISGAYLIEAIKGKHSVKAIWVKGHNGSVYNERCDTLAKCSRDKLIDSDRIKGIRE